MSQPAYRVLLAKPGLDGHERGARVVVRALRDAGMEVAYTGIRQTPEAIAEAALRFRADVVGLSILSGAHMELVPRVLDALQERGLERTLLIVGGIIPERDKPALRELGVLTIFGPGAHTGDIATFIGRAVEEARGRRTGR